MIRDMHVSRAAWHWHLASGMARWTFGWVQGSVGEILILSCDMGYHILCDGVIF